MGYCNFSIISKLSYEWSVPCSNSELSFAKMKFNVFRQHHKTHRCTNDNGTNDIIMPLHPFEPSPIILLPVWYKPYTPIRQSITYQPSQICIHSPFQHANIALFCLPLHLTLYICCKILYRMITLYPIHRKINNPPNILPPPHGASDPSGFDLKPQSALDAINYFDQKESLIGKQ